MTFYVLLYLKLNHFTGNSLSDSLSLSDNDNEPARLLITPASF